MLPFTSRAFFVEVLFAGGMVIDMQCKCPFQCPHLSEIRNAHAPGVTYIFAVLALCGQVKPGLALVEWLASDCLSIVFAAVKFLKVKNGREKGTEISQR